MYLTNLSLKSWQFSSSFDSSHAAGQHQQQPEDGHGDVDGDEDGHHQGGGDTEHKQRIIFRK